MTAYRVAAVQYVLHGQGDRRPARETMAANAARLAATIDRVVSAVEGEPPRMLVFPVLVFNGIGTALRQAGQSPGVTVDDVVIDLAGGDPILDPVLAACARHDCYVASSCVERHAAMPGHAFHSGFVLGPTGLVLRSPKTQAPTSAGISLLRDHLDAYRAAFGSDAVLPVAETPIGRLACLVQGELLIPEAVRTVARRGAEVILHPTAQRAGSGQPPATAIKQAAAWSNGVYILSAVVAREVTDHSAGRFEASFGGGTVIVEPDGAIQACIDGSDEGVIYGRVDLERRRELAAHHASHARPAASVYRALDLG